MENPNPDELIDKEKYGMLSSTYQQKKIIPYRGTYFLIDSSARMDIRGRLRLNTKRFQENVLVTKQRLDGDSRLILKGNFDIFYGGDLICFPGSRLELGSGFCNSNVILRCTEKITVGEDVAISHNVTIMDSDAHEIVGGGHIKTQPVEIGNHVWIGTGARILKGVTIGEGAVIAAGAVVTGNVPEYCMAAGVPARVIKSGVKWKL